MKRRTRIQMLTAATPAQIASSALLAACILLLVVTLMIERIKPEALAGIRAGSVDVARPIAEMLASPKQFVVNLSSQTKLFFNTYAENKQLRADNAELLQWQAAAANLKLENAQLRSLLHVVQEQNIHFISARLVSDIGAANSSTALISAGSKDGVKKNQAVVSPEGLIGRITDVGMLSSRVLLLSDSNSHIPIMGESGKHKAMLTGKSRGVLSLNYVDHGEQFRIGERLVTSGDGGMLPVGIPVAEVSKIDGLNISANAFANPDVSTMVTIIDYQF